MKNIGDSEKRGAGSRERSGLKAAAERVDHATLLGELTQQGLDIGGLQIPLSIQKKEHVCDLEDGAPGRIEKVGEVNIGRTS
ncbi:MAG TPA: hypothetical protein VIS96_08925 [Terrimicrobiaceae bacterium]